MSADTTIRVPRDRPPGYLPAWGEKFGDIRVPRTLDLGDVLADMGQALAGATVSADPALTVQLVTVTDTAVSLHVAGGEAGGRHPVRFLLALSGGDQDEIVAIQPIRDDAPAGLSPVPGLAGHAVLFGGITLTFADAPLTFGSTP